jgi:O-antigen ligase
MAFGLACLILFVEGGLSSRKIVGGLLAGLVAVYLIVQTAPEQSLERIASIPGTQAETALGAGSVQRRSYAASLAVEFAQRNPLIGVGIGNWEITRYLSDPMHQITPPHSSVLLALSEGGVVTLVLYIVLLVRTLRNFLDSTAVLRGPRNAGWLQWIARTMRASFLVFLAMSLVGDLWLNIVFYWFVGVGVVLSRLVFADAEAEAPVSSRRLAEAAA